MKAKSLRKLLNLTLLFFIFAGSSVVAAPLADPQDIFYVDLPAPSSTLRGVSQVRFRMYDDDNARPEYDVALFRPDCRTRFGTIAANDYSIKSSNDVYTKSWNTDGPILDRASIPNGNYCLKVCVTLENNNVDYSVCDSRPITLADPVNHAPVITSNPPNTLLLVGQRFGYDVNATDSDGNALTYSLTTAPSNLQINPATGEISSKDGFMQPGAYSVVVRVTDGRGGTDTQQFTITVEEEPKPEISNINILSPTKDSIFAGNDNDVKWEINNIEGIENVVLSYSTDGSSWTKIAELDKNAREYEWNVEDVPAGDYYLRVSVVAGQTTYEKISDKFKISSDTNGGQVETAASITDVLPREDSEIAEFSEISATLVPSEGAEIDKTKVKTLLDDQDISDKCNYDGNRYKCEIPDVSTGKHKVNMEFEDSKGKKASKQWIFDLAQEEGPEPSGEESQASSDTSATLTIVGAICLLLCLLLFIPWLFYTLWIRRSRDEVYENINYNTEINPANDLTDSYYPAPASTEITTNTYTPEPTYAPESVYSTEPVAAPVATDYGYAAEPKDDYSIGEGSIGVDESFQPQAAPTQSVTVNNQTPAAPPVTPAPAAAVEQTTVEASPSGDTKFDEDDIPAWLKQGDSDPVSPQGGNLQIDKTQQTTNDDTLAGSAPYSDYGLAPKLEDDEE